MNTEYLVSMTNDIAAFFASEPDETAAAMAVARHLERFWDPRMRSQLIGHFREQGGEGLSALSYAGVTLLAKKDAESKAR